MEDVSKKEEEFIDKLIDFMDELPDDGEKSFFATQLIDMASFIGSSNYYERIGLLHTVIKDIEKEFDEEIKEKQNSKDYTHLRKLN